MSQWPARDATLTDDQIRAELIVVENRMLRFSAGTDRWKRAHRRKLTLLSLLTDRRIATATMHGGEQ